MYECGEGCSDCTGDVDVYLVSYDYREEIFVCVCLVWCGMIVGRRLWYVCGVDWLLSKGGRWWNTCTRM